MRYDCKFINTSTDERRSMVIALTDDECQHVKDVREQYGEEQADLIGMCHALRRAYTEELDPKHWFHTETPAQVRMS